MDPFLARQWVTIFRDVAIVLVATFLLVFEAVVRQTPSAIVVGAGLTMLGLPVAFRLDTLFRVPEKRDDDRDAPYSSGSGGIAREE